MKRQLTAQGVVVVRRQAKNGADAVAIDVSPPSVLFKKDAAVQTAEVRVRVREGDANLDYSTSGEKTFVCGFINGSAPGAILDGRMKWAWKKEDATTFLYRLTLAAEKEVNESVWFDVSRYAADGTQTDARRMYLGLKTVADGTNGTDGNGVKSQTAMFAKTSLAKVADMTDITEWSRTFPEADVQNPYVWKVVKTEYTKSAATYSTPELVAVYDGGIGTNLLNNASFTDASNMAAWKTKSQYTALSGQTAPEDKGGVDKTNRKDGRNSWHDTCKATATTIQSKEVLAQAVDDPTRLYADERRRLEGGKWYTLSFWAKRNAGGDVMAVNAASASSLAFGLKTVRLTRGVKYIAGVTGQVKLSGVSTTTPTLVATVKSPSGVVAATLRITEIEETTVTAELTATETGEYTIFAIKSEAKVTQSSVAVSSYSIDDGRNLTTYIYPNVADTGVKAIADGKEVERTLGDMAMNWALGNSWERHTLTFKTKADMDASAAHNVLFRLLPALHDETYREVWICMPKLEEGMFATAFTDSADDAAGLDGCIVRTTEWEAGKEYRNDSESAARGLRYIDVVTVTKTQTDGTQTQTCWTCRKTHTSTAENAPTDKTTESGYRYWEKMNDMKPIRTSFLLAENAVIRFGQANRLAVMDKEGKKVQACLQGTDEKDGYTFWSGGATPEEANFRVGYDGTVRARRGVFSGLQKKEKTIVTSENFLDYFTLFETRFGNSYVPKLEHIGLMMEFSGDFSRFSDPDSDENILYIHMPGVYDGTVVGGETKEYYRSIVGNAVYILNKSKTEIALSGVTGSVVTNTEAAHNSPPLSIGYMRRFTLKHSVSDAGVENVIWEYSNPVKL